MSIYKQKTCVFGSSLTTGGTSATTEEDHKHLKMENQTVIYDVLVLGAGLAGLGAAQQLTASGKTVCVLEAQNSPGGRAKTVELVNLSKEENCAGREVEAGAQWIHGRENSLFKFAEDHLLVSSEQGEEVCGRFIRDDGKVFDEFLVKKVDFCVGEILEECEQLVNRPMDEDVSIRHYLERQFEAYLRDQHPEVDRLEEWQQLLDWHIRFQIIDNSCLDLTDVGVNEWGKYSFNGETCQAHINLRTGFRRVVDAIARKVGPDCIHCGCEVELIEWGGEVSKVSCSNGESFYGKVIIVTFPLGVLKETCQRMFKPSLPKEFQLSIAKTGYGTINKIFIEFCKPFWPSDFKGVQFLWQYPADRGDSINWTRWITGFDLAANNLMIGWVGGPGAVQMEQLPDEKILKDCLEMLETFLKIPVPNPKRFLW